MENFARVLTISALIGVPAGNIILAFTGSNSLSILGSSLVTGLLVSSAFWKFEPVSTVEHEIQNADASASHKP